MKALVLREYGTLVLEDVPEPECGLEDVLVEVRACGICGSDVHGIDGSTGRRKPPIIMGHEASGVVAEPGTNVRDWKKGERVTFDSTVSCGKCHFCRGDRTNLCERRQVLGVSCDEYRRQGAFAEYVAVPERILHRLPDELSFEQAAMVEALSVAAHAVGRGSDTPAPGDTAVVVGSGMIGLLVVQVLRAAGCGRVIAVDLDEGRLDLAVKLGAEVGLKADSRDVAEEVERRTQGRGADLVFEVVGTTPALKTALGCLRKGGTLTLVGNLSPAVELPLQSVVTREVTLHGSCASAGEYPVCLDMIARGRVDVDALVSAVAPLEEGPAWFERLHRKEAGFLKVVLRP